MFKSRKRKLEEEAKKEPDYRPTKDLHAESEENSDSKGNFPLGIVITLGVIILLIIASIIVIMLSGGPLPWNS